MTEPLRAPAPRVLLVEDDDDVAAPLRYNLESQGFAVTLKVRAEDALTHLRDGEGTDLVLMDWMLPGLSGAEACRQIRRDPRSRLLPVIMLTARGEEADKIRGLQLGADDYITKPYSVAELVARMRALLRRAKVDEAREVITLGEVTMDLTSQKVMYGNVPVKLGPTEFRMLRYLLDNPEQVHTRAAILEAVWGPSMYVELRTVDVHIRRLRKALQDAGGDDPIRTVRGAGYVYDTPPEGL